MKNVLKKLFDIQQELKVPKSQRNNFGNYNFRNCEDIMEASKPICKKYNCLLTCSDEIIVIGEHNPYLYEEKYYDKELKKENIKTSCVGQQRFYVQATATLYDLDSGESISVTAEAREEETKKGMDASQITGASSSYARKYALNGLLQLDDNKDADTNEFARQQKNQSSVKKSNDKQDFQNEKISDEQVKKIHILFSKIEKMENQAFKNFTNMEAKQKVYETYKVKSSKELTKNDAIKMIKLLESKVEE